MKASDYKDMLGILLPLVCSAGKVEMDIYRTDFAVDVKKDKTPVTEADKLAEAVILTGLAKSYPDIPTVAEEAASEGKIPEIGERFFLVDALDGTRSFIRKNAEFTVNIALIEHKVPVLGIVFAPALQQIYLTIAHDKAVMASLDPNCENICASAIEFATITTRAKNDECLAVVGSRSHMTDETRDFVEKLGVSNMKSAGSSLKFCLLAKGDADIYPRFGPTMEWDTAAGHAVLQAAGGAVLKTDGGPFIYGKADKNFLNPYFIALADTSLHRL
jgi:3'(2'), 5'-bisphosphate nucleotidase